MQDLIDAAAALADTLAGENLALAAMDIARAVTFLEAKNRATEAFLKAQERARQAALPEAAQRRIAEQVGVRLRDLAADNKRLLERAMAAQAHVVGILAEAVQTAPGARRGAPRYDRRGRANAGAMAAVALSTRA